MRIVQLTILLLITIELLGDHSAAALERMATGALVCLGIFSLLSLLEIAWNARRRCSVCYGHTRSS
jgi:hypothetical protein